MIDEPVLLQAIEYICERLSDRTAALFLGAGVNAGAKDDEGNTFPLGQGLSDWIAKDLLEDSTLSVSLDESSEMAIHALGRKSLNDYVASKFSRFQPTTEHLSLVQLPWDVIYTTNYDLLVETAAQSPAISAAGTIRSVYSTSTNISTFSENDIIYYKLHGTTDFANTDEGRLILTKEDYRYYSSHRKPLFRRLKTDLSRRTLLFIGYSLRDANFREILEDCRLELGTSTFPLSYAVRPGFTDTEERFWRDKYNIQFLSTTGVNFLTALKETWYSQGHSVVPFEERKSRTFVQVDETARFSRLAESFYRISPNDCTGQPKPEQFFRGSEASWADIRDHIPPYRDQYWALLEAVFGELQDPLLSASIYLVTGHAGTGKSTLLKSIAFTLAADFDVSVFWHIPGTPLDARAFGTSVNQEDPKRLVICVRNAAEYASDIDNFFAEIKQLKLPITILLEERKNQWLSATHAFRSKASVAEFELGELSKEEIKLILDALQAHNALGKLTGTDRAYQEDHFIDLASKELLIALRELTTDTTFDSIVRDEYDKIPSELAKKAYVYVAALGQLDIGLSLRYETIIRLLNLGSTSLRPLIFEPTERVLISIDETGGSRHNAGYRLSTRHPIIASIIFDTAASDDQQKFDIINEIISQLDEGYHEDRVLLNQIVKHRELVYTIGDPYLRRAVYERLASVLPNDPYVLQHRSILERDLGNPVDSVKYAREALRMDRTNGAFINTLGMALEAEARTESDPFVWDRLVSEATDLFDEGVRRSSRDAFGYLGKHYILRQRIERTKDSEERALLEASSISLLEEAFEATDGSTVIAKPLAELQASFGSKEYAIEIISAGLRQRPSDTRLRDVWIRLERELGNLKAALQIAQDGAKYDPTSWRMQRHIARLLRDQGESAQSVKGHYEAAIRHNKGDIGLMVELGAFLYKQGNYSDANAIFAETVNLRLSHAEKSRPREVWKEPNGRNKIFNGRVKSIHGASGHVITVPENFEAFFWRNSMATSNLREGENVRFEIAFNGWGPLARILISA